MDELDENPLYIAFMTKFQKEFEIACKLSCIIAIPKSDSLNDLEIDQILVNSHILLPSRLLKMHFTPLQVGYCVDVEVENGQMIAHLNTKPKTSIKVNILAQEVGYNSDNKEFKTLIIDQPLLATRTKPLFRSIISPGWSDNHQTKCQLLNSKPPQPLSDHDDCSRYLERISQTITQDLEKDVKRLQSNYLILSQYLYDAADRINHLCEKYELRYQFCMAKITGSIIGEAVKHAIKLAAETYVIHLMHGKLMATIINRHEREDRILIEQFHRIRESQLTICQLGAQAVFANFIISDELICELKQFSHNHQSPLALVSHLINIMGMISECLTGSVELRGLLGDVNCMGNKKITICSDDLIASLIYSLAQTCPDHLYSISKYLDTFSWTPSAKDQAAYYTATFQIVIQYIMSFSPTQSWNDECSGRAHLATCGDVSTLSTTLKESTDSRKPLDSDGSRLSHRTDLDLSILSKFSLV